MPTNQGTYSNADFCALLNDAMLSWLVPTVRKVRENYFLAKQDFAIMAGQDTYAITSRAMGGSLRLLQYVYSGGQSLRKLPALELQDLQNISNTATGVPQGFYWNGNNVTLYPSPVTAGGDLLRFWFFMRPNAMVTPDQVGLVQSSTSTTITLSAAPPTGFSSGALYDVVQAAPPFGTLSYDNPATIAGNVLTFANTLPTSPTGVKVGDQVCLAQQAAVAQVPLELQSVLVQRAIVMVLEGVGDMEALAAARAELQRMEMDVAVQLTPRSEGNPKKAVNRVWG